MTDMLPTNQYFRAKLQCLDARLRQMDEGGPLDPVTIAAADRIREEREVANLVLLNRRVEAARPVVNFRRWRSGDGAAQLLAANDAGLRRALAS